MTFEQIVIRLSLLSRECVNAEKRASHSDDMKDIAQAQTWLLYWLPVLRGDTAADQNYATELAIMEHANKLYKKMKDI